MRTDPELGLSPSELPVAGLPGRDFADGVSQSGSEPNRLFLSVAGERFLDASGVSGLDHEGDGRAFAWLDFDRDGWRDVAVVSANTPLFQLFRNEIGGSGRSIALLFEGANREAKPAAGRSNRDGYGARVEIDLGDETLVREHRAGEGLAAQNAARLLVGIGEHDAARAITVHWPSGAVQRVENVRAGTELVVFEDPERAPDGSGSARSVYRRALAPVAEERVPEEPLLSELPDTATLRVLTTLATWCEACTEELPELALLRARFEASQVALYGVPVDPEDTSAKLGRWVRAHRPPYQVLADLPSEQAARVRAHVETVLRRDALPASVVIDGDGRVLRTLWGAPTVSDLNALLQNAVSSATAGG